MATLLLLVIYITFISLGIPDSLLGAAWPAIYPAMGVSVSLAGIAGLSITCGTIISSLIAPKIIVRFGTKYVTLCSILLCGLALFGYSMAPSFPWLILMAIPLGFGGGAIDVALNDYVALHYNAAQMNLLHAFWGIGVTIGPYLMSIGLSKYENWRQGYRMAATAELAIAILFIITLPLWNKINSSTKEVEEESRVAPYSELFKNKYIRCVWLMMITSCAIENMCGVWASTFMVEAKGIPADTAALYAMGYCVGLTVGRLLSGIIAIKLSSWKIIKLGLCFVALGLVILLLPLSSIAAFVGLFLLGFGNGPVVPNLNHLTPKLFGEDISSSLIASQMTAAYVGILGAPPIFGFIIKYLGLSVFPVYLGIFFLCFLGGSKYLSVCVKERTN